MHLPNLRVGEADAATGAPLTINVALDRPNPYSVPGVGDRGRLHDAAGAEYGPHVRHRDAGRRLRADHRSSGCRWAPGQQIATFPVTLLGDTLDEAEENINIRISGPSGVTIRDNDIDIVLRDNDPNPLVGSHVLMPNAAITRGRHGLRARTRSTVQSDASPLRRRRRVERRRLHRAAGARHEPHVRHRDAGRRLPGVPVVHACTSRPARTRRRSQSTCAATRCAEIDEEIDVRISGPSGLRIADNDLDLVLRDDDA